jgi:O-methyltransferase involved in polyketide biosynthesis
VLDDYLALDLAGVEGLALRERLRAEVPASLLLAFGRWMCVRARFAENLVEHSVREGVGQHVILGAD